MAVKRIIVACGGAIATSTVAANKIREICDRNGIDADVTQARITELESMKDQADLIVTTAKVRRDYGVPVIHGVAFISGIGIEATERKILDALQST
ncbi:PTS system galactitol-specific EIIB component, Gat family [Coriobacterium glomerans PW2]|uniref:PTS system galactitol-specific EIIB component, Gat family n=1 Tax=Coriobacterium glomerans (strain ATCC 49209 / DSM 20642 / JCM 10262 / PW2) TaxID=700015 RepID=F2NAK6_CORGP|nr:PTS galactitol transporter subunit IIB [Coriobacterium glomerans]AEB06533.1 PTS system galactitol-specific EIIB component, Gat family [Coriobacterium glomerans PW2]